MTVRDLEACHGRIVSRTIPGAGGCVLSTYSTGSHGYAQAWDGATVVLAHRIVWEYAHGPIPGGMTVDHLRLLSNVENATDNGMSAFRTRAPAGRQCRRGLHEMTLDRHGKAGCIECANERRRERRAQS